MKPSMNDAIRILKENNFVLGINVCDGLKEKGKRGFCCNNCCLLEYADDFCAMTDRDGKELYEILVRRVRKEKLEKLLSQ